jgi:hypothetical protein
MEQGQAQKISLFSEQVVDPIAAVLPRMTTPTGTVIFSNRFEESPGLPVSATVILIDALNTPIPDFAYARAEIINFLHKLQPQDRVALYGLASRLFVLHDFTNDAGSLLRSLEHAKSNPSDYRPGTEDLQASDIGNDNLDAFIAAAERRTLTRSTERRIPQWRLHPLPTIWRSCPGARTSFGFPETLNVVFSPQAYETSLRDGLRFSREVAINEGTVLVRFVACDFGSGAIGSVDIPLQKVFPHEDSPTATILR